MVPIVGPSSHCRRHPRDLIPPRLSLSGRATEVPRRRRHASESMDAMPDWVVETREIGTRQSCMGRLLEWTPAPDGTATQSRRC